MHPVLSGPRVLSWYLLAWLAVGAALASVLALSATAPWRNALWFAIPVCLVYAFALPSAYYVCRAMPFTRRGFATGLALFAGSALVAGAVAWALCQAWNQFSLALEQSWAGIALSSSTGLALFAGGAGIYLLSLLLHDVLMALDQVRPAQQRELASRALAHATELQMLRTQIHPHFLFNCLNSISALTSMDPPAARAMTIALAQYFRQTLSMSEQTSIPLEQEIAHCRCFLDIEAQRFGARLAVDISIPAEAQTALVPPMLLQPLVENAVKHGIASSGAGGTVRIHAVVRDAWLYLQVDNPVEDHRVQGLPPQTDRGLGLGLRNVQQRLASIYGEQARLAQHVAVDRFVVELTLPLTTAAPAVLNP